MLVVTCPECLAKFESSGARGTSCPTCGHRFGPSRRADDAPRRSYRRYDDEDDFDDRRPARRPRRERSTAADSLVPLLILGGALFVVLAIGGIGFLVYRAVERAPGGPRDVARVQPAEAGPPGILLAAEPDDGLPGVNPADLPGNGGPPPAFSRPPDDPQVPGVDPGQLQPPPGVPGRPRPPATPRPPGMPGMPQPPAVPAPGAAATVTLSNLRRARGPGLGDALEVDYQYTAGAAHPAFDKLVVRTASGLGEVPLTGPRQKGTVRIRARGGPGQLQGRIEVWMERRSAATLPGADGQRISNTVTLD